ncbi:PREDICTED: uncharacterized protein LOC108566683 isoform X2 [Nicrophorus vespilloides]|uniref:Uncharacterized protein LOC108566683 isoform X2 n=1 Tax=Nicrophorus vespilloides TaxID=110193 RepID=A0ABM1N5R3_NICVS|nr:PREDICTED: uncharacterized protein LOC108566683 isoform X2 [Nicrophorus vespilloides]
MATVELHKQNSSEERILNSNEETLETKIKALIKTWGEFGSLKCMPSQENFHTLAQYLKNHTLNIVLSFNWLKHKDIYYKQLVHAIDKCSKYFVVNTSFQLTCRKLLGVAKSPWQKLPIIRMLNCSKPLIQIEDYNYFVYEESGYFISMRLQKLCEDRCEDMALNLTRTYIKCCEWADMYNKNMYISADQRKFVFDVYLALLYKLNQTKEMSGLLKEMTFSDGVDMVRRFSCKLITASKIWLNSICIAQLSGTIFLTRGVMQPVEEIEVYLNELLEVWLATYENDEDQEDLIACLRRIMRNAFTSSHMYLIVRKLDCKFGIRMRNYNVEVYIQALNTDMNLLEKLKTDNDNEEKVTETTIRVADGLLRLANLLKDNLRVSRECLLSAFSLRPSLESLLQIEGAARASGYNVLDTGQWTCRFHKPAQPEDDLLILCDYCNDYSLELKLNNPALKQPNTALSEALRTNRMGLSEEICDDLVVIIFCTRYQLLSWLQCWDDLHRLCIMYLNDPVKTKNLITELKYVDVDYTPFLLKREMEMAESQLFEETILNEYTDLKKKKKRKRVVSSGEDETSDDESLCPTAKDPDAIKTLRLFRKSLKSVQVEPEQSAALSADIHHPSVETCPVVVTTQSSSSAHDYTVTNRVINDDEETPRNESKAVLHIRKDLFETSAWPCLHKPNERVVQTNEKNSKKNFSQEPVTQAKIEEEVKNTEYDNLVSAEAKPVNELGSGADINDNNVLDLEAEKRLLEGPDDCEDLHELEQALFGDTDMTSLNRIMETSTGRLYVDDNTIEVDEDLLLDERFDGYQLNLKSESNSVTNDSSNAVEVKESMLVDEHNLVAESNSVSNITKIETTSPKLNSAKKILDDWAIEENDIVESKVEAYTFRINPNELVIFEDMEVDNTLEPVVEEINCDDVKPAMEGTCPVTCTVGTEVAIKTELPQTESVASVQAPVERVSPLLTIDKSPLVVSKDSKNKIDNETVVVDDEPENVVVSRTRSSALSQLPDQVKYNLRECRVVLNRVKEPPIAVQKPVKRKRKAARKAWVTRRKQKKSEFVESNVSQQGTKDENYNSLCNVQKKPIRDPVVLEALKKKLLVESDTMNPRVVLERLNDSSMKSLLARVPGIKDLNLMRPESTDRVVNVVQVAGGRTSSTVTSGNTQTSTQVSPHIQRIGQPRSEKNSEPSNSESATSDKATSNSYKSAVTQSPTLINMLTQQITRPSHGTRSRTGPIINIISQQSIKPAIKVENNSSISPANQDSQANSTSRTTPIQNSDTSSNSGPLKSVVGGKIYPAHTVPTRPKSDSTQAVSTSTDSSNREECSIVKIASSKSMEKNSETLPKFQQAFGKSVYQNSVDSTNATTNNLTNNVTDDIDKDKQQNKNACVSMQPIQGSVIYTRQVPVGQAINLIPQTRGQVFRIATSTNPKDTVIQNKMNALLAAALQGKTKSSEPLTEDSDAPDSNVHNGTDNVGTTRIQVAQPSLVQTSRIVKPVLQIPTNVIRNTPQTNLSSTTLEQLREFDMVYKQVTERSSTSTPADAGSAASTESNDSTTSPQCISVTYLNQTQKLNCSSVVVVSSYNNLQPAVSPALSVASQGSSSPCVTPASTPTPVLPKVAVKTTKGGGKTIKTAPIHPAKTSPNIPKPQQKSQEDEQTTQRIFDILAEYAEQLRNSPDLNNKPAPRRRSNPPTNPSQNSKRKKSSSSKKSGQCSLSSDADIDDPRTAGSEDSSCGIVQISMQDDEQTSAAGNASESNDSTPTTTTTRQQLILTDSSHTQTRNLIIADSSVGEALKMPNTAVLVPGNYIMPVSMVKGGQQIAVVSGGSKILATVPARSGPNMLLFQSFLNQTRKTNVSTVKYSTIQPLTGISSQTLAGVSAQPPVILPPPGHGISTVTLGQPIAIKTIEETERVNTEIVLTISQSRETNRTPAEDNPQPDSSTSIATKLESDIDENTAMSESSSDKKLYHKQPLKTTSTSNSTTTTTTAPIATPVIAQNIKIEETSDSSNTQGMMTLNINPMDVKGEKIEERRVQSVLVTAGSSNGPMLSRSPSRSKQLGSGSSGVVVVSAATATVTAANTTATVIKTESAPKEKFSKHTKKNDKTQQNHAFCMQGRLRTKTAGGRVDKDGGQQFGTHRRQAAMDREIRLQKSLSEECEDLGVDEPNSCDLFPEAVLFDAHNSPSFDQTSQELLRRTSVLHAQQQDKADDQKLTLFADDDLMFDASHHPSVDVKKQYSQKELRMTHKVVINGQCSVASAVPVPSATVTAAIAATTGQCKDNTLLQTCTSMSDVTLSSPLSPEKYHANTPPATNKSMLKYSNKKRADRKPTDNWPIEVSSSEDVTTGSSDRMKSSNSSDNCANKNSRSDEDVSDNALKKVVHISISKTECSDNHCDSDCDSVSGRGSRKSSRNKCTCNNGMTEVCSNSRKRPSTQQQHISNPHKKAFSTKTDNSC